MATNNDGHLLDSSGNVAVDFVWGNFPLQPNDVRSETSSFNATGGTTGSTVVQNQSAVVTAASADGTTVTYTAANTFTVGETVSITGLSTSAFNLTNVRVASLVGSAGAYTGFTVTNAATGSGVTGATAAATGVIGLIPGVGADTGYSTTTDKASTYLSFTDITKSLWNGLSTTVPADNHVRAETGWAGYPGYIAATGKFNITQVDGDGTTVTYQAFNTLSTGDTVDITGCSGFNLTSATVAKATRDYFTVTNSTAGSLININNGIVQRSDALTAADGSYVSGTAYMTIPSILGLTTALGLDALKDAGYIAANITNTTGVTNTATQPTDINVTTTSAATVTVAGGTGTWPVGTKVTIAAGTGIPTALVGTWTVTGGSGSTLVIAGSGWTVADTGAITPGTKLTGASGTVKTQSVAAGAASIALGTTITMTSWA